MRRVSESLVAHGSEPETRNLSATDTHTLWTPGLSHLGAVSERGAQSHAQWSPGNIGSHAQTNVLSQVDIHKSKKAYLHSDSFL